MTPAEVQAARARAEAATVGPWVRGDTDDHEWGEADCVYAAQDPARGPLFSEAEEEADAAFIAAARTDVPALCDEVERLRLRWEAEVQKVATLTEQLADVTRERDAALVELRQGRDTY